MLAALFFLLVFRDPSGRVLFKPDGGPEKLIVKGEAYEFAPRPDGRQVIDTLSGEGPNRTLVLWDAGTSKSLNLATGLVRDARWSTDGRQIAFLKHTGEWRAWLMAPGEPGKARELSARPVHAMVGWSGDVLVVSDSEALHWLAPDGSTRQSMPLATIYGKQFHGKQFQWMSPRARLSMTWI